MDEITAAKTTFRLALVAYRLAQVLAYRDKLNTNNNLTLSLYMT